MSSTQAIDWYDRRDELQFGMVFNSCWGVVRLDRQVPGDATQWYAASWGHGGWSYGDATVEPGDLTERLADDYAGEVL